jgi:hypothetical protein
VKNYLHALLLNPVFVFLGLMVKGISHHCVFFTSTLVGFTTKGHKVAFYSAPSSPPCCDCLAEEHEGYTLRALSNHCRVEPEPYLSVMAPLSWIGSCP